MVRFWSIVFVVWTLFKIPHFEGICGLGFQTIAVDGVIPPFMHMVQNGAVKQGLFTVWMTKVFQRSERPARSVLSRLKESSEGAVAGRITYGGYDTQNCNMSADGTGITWVSLTATTYWQIKIDG